MAGQAKDPRINQVIRSGRAGGAAVHGTTEAGKSYAHFDIACHQSSKDRFGNNDDGTVWYRCTGWGQFMVDRIRKEVHKGAILIVTGRLKEERWQDKNGGHERNATAITIDNISSCEWPNDGEPQGDEPAPPSEPVQQPIPDDDIPF